ncbi:RagB/SusD family nutrient uptake outer membrane protein [Reichenbachiella carrageenanivorans]|uniref:RagB/SusD family nutrient uptake outer membrane protein n=1 Tax=Reichenbachiella carrageenanivorans TaxID=2979869 RepID=A0ABY6CZP9_9BACT|nr:RagB/SusD family nutrient uptake outer membrane protein [Reichenbachiella carrageenanivorans]UXX79362.1 RagB/SusD family nutrient uptake outer membrane protein [Reichenbachiella carrageenanivorans]
MKNYTRLLIKYTLSIAACFSVWSCTELDENPKGRLNDPEVAFQDISNLNAVSIAMYAAIRGDGSWAEGFATTQYMTTMFGADDITTIAGGNKEPFREFDEFSKSPSNIWMSNLYKGCYRAILNANAVIEYSKYTQDEQSAIDNLVGQAHFIRALSYFYLVRSWGEIPMYTTPDAPIDLGLSEVSVVYEQIIADLKEAEALLPDTQSEVGRPKKGAAMALLAKVYLTKAGWPLKDESAYALAASKAGEVITQKGRWGFDLLPSFDMIWKRANDNSSESVFSIQYDRNTGDGAHANHLIGTASMPKEENGWEDFFCELTFYNEFPAGPRKDATFYTVFYTSDGGVVNFEDSDARHPYYAKFRDGAVDEAQPWVNNFHTAAAYALIRYADVLLIFAEATAQATGVDTQAYDAINEVRNRAGLPDLTVGLSKADFVNAVIEERGWELAGEGQRWYDLLRTEKVQEVIDKRHPDEPVKITGAITPDNFYAPIPEAEVLKNPNLAK